MKNIIGTFAFTVLLISCGSKNSSIDKINEKNVEENLNFFHTEISEKPIYSNSPYTKNIKKCARTRDYYKACKVSETPFIGLDDGKDTEIVKILNKTLISRDWQGENFKNFLLENKDNKELLHLFKHTTGVIISHRLHNSFFMPLTGMIYIEAKYFYNQEVDLGKDKNAKFLYEVADPRTENYSEEKDDRELVNYLAFDDFRSKDTELSTYSKDPQQMNLSLIRVLYHELTHAADLFSYNLRNSESYQLEMTFTELYQSNIENKNLISQKMSDSVQNISSDMLNAVEQCTLEGETSHDEYKDCQFDINEIMDEFRNSDKVSLYGFYTIHEHIATLHTHLLMLKNHNVMSTAVFLETDEYLNKEKRNKTIINSISLKITNPKPFNSASLVYSEIYNTQVDKSFIRNIVSFELEDISYKDMVETLNEKMMGIAQ